MVGQPTTYSQFCSMSLDNANRISQMIVSHTEFLGIDITINQDRKTYSPLQVAQTLKGEFLVTFEIPREIICMPDFFREFSNALQLPESTATVQRERG